MKLDQGQDKAFNEAEATAIAEELMEEVEEAQPKEIDLDQLGQIISKANELSDLVKELNPISETQFSIQAGIDNLMACYKLEQK